MVRPKNPKNPNELIHDLVSGLRRTAVAPTIAAYKALPHQERFHKSTAKKKLFIGGNRSGKTVGGAAEAVFRLTGNHPYRTDLPRGYVRGRIVAVDFDQGVEKIVKPEVKKWIPPSMLINGSWEDSFNKQLRTLTLSNGSMVEFMSYDQDMDKFAGTSRHFVWFDEEPPENIFNENLLRLVDTNGDYWITMTPLIEMSWTFDRLYEPWTLGDKSVDVFEVETTENTYISEEALDAALAGMSEAEKKARKSGTYISHTGLVYGGSFSKFNNVVPDVLTDGKRWHTLSKHWGHFCMLDHGLRNPTAILFGAYDQEGRIIIYDEYYERDRLVSENAQAFLRKVEDLRISPEYIVGDPSIWNRDPISGSSVGVEYGEHGVYISKANNDISGGIVRVQHRFEKKLLFISERCQNTLWELNRYRWDRFVSSKIQMRRNQKETPIKKDDHAMDALRYGVASRPSLPGEVDTRVGNVLELPRAGPIDFDWSRYTDGDSPVQYDSSLGSVW